MAAIDTSALIARNVAHIAKRSNWAGREAGVIVVFAIVFIVAVGVVGLLIHKCLARRKANQPQK
jgi:spore maturation protein SpmA